MTLPSGISVDLQGVVPGPNVVGVGPSGPTGPTGPTGPAGLSANAKGAYAAGTTYSAGPPPDAVIGSNGHWYVSLSNANIGHDPTTDGGVHWLDTQIAATSYVDNAVNTETSRATAVEATKAPTAFPTFSGKTIVPTPPANDNSQQAVNSAWVQSFVNPVSPPAVGFGRVQFDNSTSVGLGVSSGSVSIADAEAKSYGVFVMQQTTGSNGGPQVLAALRAAHQSIKFFVYRAYYEVATDPNGMIQFTTPAQNAAALTADGIGWYIYDNTQTGVTGNASTGTFTLTGHGYAVNDQIVFSGLGGGGGFVSNAVKYYVTSVTTNTFTLSLTKGGATITGTSNVTSGTVKHIFITGGNALMDFSNAGYQSQGITNAKAAIAANGGYDGLFHDNVFPAPIADLTYPVIAGTILASDSAWVTAMTNWLTALNTGISVAGSILMGNLGGGRHSATAQGYMANGVLDMQYEESAVATFSNTSTATYGGTAIFAAQLANLVYNESKGKLSLLRGYVQSSADMLNMVVGLALLGTQGNTYIAVDNASDGGLTSPYTSNPYGYGNPYSGRPAPLWQTVYDSAKNLGQPSAAYTNPLGTGGSNANYYTRQFVNGKVYVNANTSGSITDPDGTVVAAEKCIITIATGSGAAIGGMTQVTASNSVTAPTTGWYEVGVVGGGGGGGGAGSTTGTTLQAGGSGGTAGSHQSRKVHLTAGTVVNFVIGGGGTGGPGGAAGGNNNGTAGQSGSSSTTSGGLSMVAAGGHGAPGSTGNSTTAAGSYPMGGNDAVAEGSAGMPAMGAGAGGSSGIQGGNSLGSSGAGGGGGGPASTTLGGGGGAAGSIASGGGIAGASGVSATSTGVAGSNAAATDYGCGGGGGGGGVASAAGGAGGNGAQGFGWMVKVSS